MKPFTNYWKKAFNYGTSQRGVVLVVVTLALILLTAIITSAHFTIVSQTSSSSSYRLSTQASYVAEAGIQRTMDWFSHKYNAQTIAGINATVYPPKISPSGTPIDITFSNSNASNGSYPVSATRTDFQSYLGSDTTMSGTPNNFQIVAATGNNVTGQYIVTATLLSTRQIKVFPNTTKMAEKWRIDSIGRVLNGAVELARADNSAVIETLVIPLFNNAVCVKNDFRFNGGIGVDSYDSANPYGGTNKDGKANVGAEPGAMGTTYGFDVNGPNGSLDGTINIPTGVPTASPARPSICPNATDGCGGNLCNVFPPVPTFVNPNAGNPLVPYPTIGTGVGQIPNDLRADRYFYKAANCPTGCLTSNDCRPATPLSVNYPAHVSLPGTVGSASFPIGSSVGPVVEEIIGSQTSGGRIALPANFSGDACFWIKKIHLSQGGSGSIIIDNLTNRTSPGVMNVFVYSLPVGGNHDLNILSNKNNPVNIYVYNDMQLGGNSTTNMNTSSTPVSPTPSGVTYASQNPQGLRIFGSPNLSTLQVQGTARFSGLIYAPNSLVDSDGNSDIYGIVIANDFRQNGGGNGGVHYDRQLSNDFVNIYNFVPANQIRRIR